MSKYKIIVRDYDYNQPSDERLICLDGYFESSIVDLDFENNPDKAMDEFDDMFGKYYQHFLNKKYELIAVEND